REDAHLGCAEDVLAPGRGRGDRVVQPLVPLAQAVDLDGKGDRAVPDKLGGVVGADGEGGASGGRRHGGAGGTDGEVLVAGAEAAGHGDGVAPQREGGSGDPQRGTGEGTERDGDGVAGGPHDVNPSPARTWSRSMTTVPRSATCAAASAAKRSSISRSKAIVTSSVNMSLRPSSSVSSGA